MRRAWEMIVDNAVAWKSLYITVIIDDPDDESKSENTSAATKDTSAALTPDTGDDKNATELPGLSSDIETSGSASAANIAPYSRLAS